MNRRLYAIGGGVLLEAEQRVGLDGSDVGAWLALLVSIAIVQSLFGTVLS